jgi:predicted Zn finger-like uncharacterized protein
MMLIHCPHCTTSYEVEPASLGVSGRSVRCARCQQVWFAAAPLDFSTEPPEAPLADEMSAPIEAQQPGAEPSESAGPSSLDEVEQAVADAERVIAETVDVPERLDDRGPAEIREAPPLVPPQEPEAGGETEAQNGDAGNVAIPEPSYRHDGHDLEALVAQRAQRILTRKHKHLSSIVLPAAIICLLTVIAALLLWRKDVVRLAPQTASLYARIGLPVNLRGLSFINIRSSTEMQDNVPVLVVEGQIVSESRLPVEIPRLRFAIRNAAGYEIYSWTSIASRNAIGPGEAIDFRSRLASPPAEGRDVAVRFFNRRDLLAGMR